MPDLIFDAALALRQRGFWGVPLVGKRPMLDNWPDLRLEPADNPTLWNGRCTGLGVNLGASGLADIDADCLAAEHVLAELAPDTGLVWEHGGRRHRAYRCADAGHREWDLPPQLVAAGEKASLVEVRAGKHQSALPPSLHPDTGQRYAWVQDGEPSAATNEDLHRVARLSAIAGLMSCVWVEGLRQRGDLALAGFLLRRGITEEECRVVVKAICSDAEDFEVNKRLKAVQDTYNKGTEAKTTGLPTIRAVFGDVIADWLAREFPDTVPAAPAANDRVADWPEPVGEHALIGLAGDVVRVIGPHTESDPMSLLSQFLVGFGSIVGRHAYARVESDRHYMNEFAVLVGESSKARKGTSWGHVRRGLAEIDPEWNARIKPGLSSGEGLIWAVRDPIMKQQAVKEKGRVVDYQEVIEDAGISDKRLLILEEEFASVLKTLAREGNTLSAIVRAAWNTGDLSTLTKNSTAVATGAHISLIGHVTKDELRRYLDNTEAVNGFANRIMWVCARRSQCLPEGGRVPMDEYLKLTDRVREAVQFAKNVGEVHRDERARRLWFEVYEDLSAARTGLLGAVTSRAEAHVMRLSCLYALLDLSAVVHPEHLMAALDFWAYCKASARYIFGDALGDPVADTILERLRRSVSGLTRTEIRDLFQRHQSTARIEQALQVLVAQRKVRCVQEETDGRPAERWFAV